MTILTADKKAELDLLCSELIHYFQTQKLVLEELKENASVKTQLAEEHEQEFLFEVEEGILMQLDETKRLENEISTIRKQIYSYEKNPGSKNTKSGI